MSGLDGRGGRGRPPHRGEAARAIGIVRRKTRELRNRQAQDAVIFREGEPRPSRLLVSR